MTRESTVSFLKNVAKAAIIMFAVGALLASVAPWIAIATGVAEAGATYATAAQALGNAANPLWTGAFFGAFGTLQAAIAPIVSKFFEPPKPGTTLVVAQASGLEQALSAPSHAPSTAQTISPTHFQNMVASQQAASGLNPGGKVV